MLGAARPIAFVATANPSQARAFYQGVLGLRLVADEQSALVFDSAGIMLRVSKVQTLTPLPFTVLGWEVSTIRSTLSSLRNKGVAFLHFEGMPQDSDGVLAFPDGTLVAWFKDPDGNMLSLTQFPKQPD